MESSTSRSSGWPARSHGRPPGAPAGSKSGDRSRRAPETPPPAGPRTGHEAPGPWSNPPPGPGSIQPDAPPRSSVQLCPAPPHRRPAADAVRHEPQPPAGPATARHALRRQLRRSALAAGRPHRRPPRPRHRSPRNPAHGCPSHRSSSDFPLPVISKPPPMRGVYPQPLVGLARSAPPVRSGRAVAEGGEERPSPPVRGGEAVHPPRTRPGAEDCRVACRVEGDSGDARRPPAAAASSPPALVAAGTPQDRERHPRQGQDAPAASAIRSRTSGSCGLPGPPPAGSTGSGRGAGGGPARTPRAPPPGPAAGEVGVLHPLLQGRAGEQQPGRPAVPASDRDQGLVLRQPVDRVEREDRRFPWRCWRSGRWRTPCCPPPRCGPRPAPAVARHDRHAEDPGLGVDRRETAASGRGRCRPPRRRRPGSTSAAASDPLAAPGRISMLLAQGRKTSPTPSVTGVLPPAWARTQNGYGW